jgi:hypothetical protein
MRQAERSSGFLGGGLLVNAKNVFWTMTACKDEEAMNAYRTGGAHRRAVPKLFNLCNEAAVVYWNQESLGFPFGKRSINAWRMEGGAGASRGSTPAMHTK